MKNLLALLFATITLSSAAHAEFGFVESVFGSDSIFNSEEIPQNRKSFYINVNNIFYENAQSEEDIADVLEHLTAPESNKNAEWKLFIEGRSLNEDDFSICGSVFGGTSNACKKVLAHVTTGDAVLPNTRYQCPEGADFCSIKFN